MDDEKKKKEEERIGSKGIGGRRSRTKTIIVGSASLSNGFCFSYISAQSGREIDATL